MMLDIIAVIIGVLYTVRKLDVRKREPEQFPHVPAAEFERWRSRETGAYSLMSTACFLKVFVDYAFLYLARRSALEPSSIRIIGASIFVAWLAALVYGSVRASQARKLRESLNINLATRPAPG
ncbi:MAG TPA: hypothetical protein VK524_10550 [Polyangiaceae bacterium]|nr:hypothetical protein [Polyangiaceae bacterium]